MSSVEPFQARCDGQAAFLTVESHNYGPGKWDNVIKKAERVVLTSNFDNTNPWYPVGRHIVNHRDAHNDMIRASEADNYIYQLPNNHTRVQRLFHSIKLKDTRVITAKAGLLTNPTLANNFEAADEHFICLLPPATRSRPPLDDQTILAVTKDKNGYRPAKIGKTGVELRYYKKTHLPKFHQGPEERTS